MPLYEYVCNKCENRFEKLVKSMSSSDSIQCPKCNSKQTHRAMSVFAVSSSTSSSGSPTPSMGECCPCGKNRGSCSMN